MSSVAKVPKDSLFGHPAGLYTLFFAEMWERFSYYGMRALLILYMIKGFLGYNDDNAYVVYGAYTALVYMTPFFGGMLADRLLGARRSVIFGAILMAAGEAMLMLPQLPAHLAAKYVQSLHLQPFMQAAFFTGLALLIIGNGFFKPNISTIVGTLYAKYPGKRDGGFTIFYMGINLGAAMSPLLCGYVGETYGWSWGFGLATVGMLIGLAVFVLPRLLTAVAILCGAIAAAGGLVWFHPVEILSTAVNIFVAASVLGAAVVAAVAISRGGLPHDAGRPAHPGRLQRRILGLPAAWLVYLGAIVLVPAFMLLVSGGVLLTANGHPVVFIPDKTISQLEKSASPLAHVGAVCLKEVSTPVGLILALSGLLAFGYLGVETFRLDRIGRHRMYVILILVFFSMLFWAFAEQAGSSINNFTDRNVRRVITTAATPVIDRADLGKTIELQPTQEQLGFHNGDRLFTIDVLNKLRERSERQEGFPDRMEGGGGQRGHEDRAPRRRNPRQPLPGRQPCLHHAAGVGVLGPLELSGRAGVGAEHAAEVRLGALAAWAGFRGFLGRRNWPTSAGWSRSAGSCWATCCRPPANSAFPPWAWP